MRLTVQGRTVHLGYCTNIHAGEDWPAVSASLERYIPAVRAGLERLLGRPAPAPFGIGLRLSGCAAAALAAAPALQAFQAQLARLHAYVYTINAFPYGTFHGAPVKEQVYQPDWRTAQRLDYTVQTARILARLLPDGVSGSVSTVPGAFAAAIGPGERADIALRLARAAVALAAIERDTGRHIALALEPEPACMLETADDALEFFSAHLLDPAPCARLAARLDTAPARLALLLRRHLGVCYDVCHAAVAYEDPLAGLRRLSAAGIAVPKIQLSSALRIAPMTEAMLAEVSRLDQGIYLHQVVVRSPAPRRYTDLPQALADYRGGEARGEWRIHCHVPIFMPRAGPFGTTQASLLAVLDGLPALAELPHLEVETYTWDVLPAALRSVSKPEAIARELAFVMERLADE